MRAAQRYVLIVFFFFSLFLFISEVYGEENARIIINLPARQLSVLQGDAVVSHYPVAVGSPVYKTPLGSRVLKQIIWNPWWLPPPSPWAAGSAKTPPGPNNPLGPVKMDLGQAILLHGTNNESTVGRAASHGCMRMFNKDAQALAWWVQSNYTDKTDPALLEQYQKKRGTSYYVVLPEGIPVDIRYEIFEMSDGSLKIHPDIYNRVKDKKKKAREFLEAQGYDLDRVDEKLLSNALEMAKKDSTAVEIAKLFPVNVASKKAASKEKVAALHEVDKKNKEAF